MNELPRVGQIFQNRYLIHSELGRGGTGLVFKAKQVDADREVAIKTLRPEKRSDSETVARFFREFRLLATLSHPNIMTVYGVSLDQDSSPYAVCEYVEGTSLRSLVYADEKISFERILRIALQICDACQYAHSQGVIHRDLKPDNIMVQDKPSPDSIKILDFGLSKSFVESPADAKLTMTGQLIGTPHYMSPEQAGMKSDARTDIYALGCILFELLSGEHLFDADSSMGIVFKQINDDVQERLSIIETPIPKRLFASLAQMLEKDPEQRFQSMADVSGELKDILLAPSDPISGKEWKLVSDNLQNKKRGLRSGLTIAAVSILAINCVLFFGFYLQSREANRQNKQEELHISVSATIAAIKQLESKGDFIGALEQYVPLLESKSLDEFEHCFLFMKATDCVSAALFLSSEKAEKSLANNALLVSRGAKDCAVKRRDFGSFSRAVAVESKALQLLDEKRKRRDLWSASVKSVDQTWGRKSKAAVQIRYAACLAFLEEGDFDAASQLTLDCMKLVDEGVTVAKDDLLSIKCSWILILHKKGQDTEALIRLKECDQEFLEAEGLNSSHRRLLLERLLTDHAQLDQLDSFEDLLAQDIKQNTNLYKSSLENFDKKTSRNVVSRRQLIDVPALMYLFLAMKYSEKRESLAAYRNYMKAYSLFDQSLKETEPDRYFCLLQMRAAALSLGKNVEARDYHAKVQKMLLANPDLSKYTQVSTN